jgi:hypothetical protein
MMVNYFFNGYMILENQYGSMPIIRLDVKYKYTQKMLIICWKQES